MVWRKKKGRVNLTKSIKWKSCVLKYYRGLPTSTSFHLEAGADEWLLGLLRSMIPMSAWSYIRSSAQHQQGGRITNVREKVTEEDKLFVWAHFFFSSPSRSPAQEAENSPLFWIQTRPRIVFHRGLGGGKAQPEHHSLSMTLHSAAD